MTGAHVGSTPRRIGLVGCVKKKSKGRALAKDLYVSALFKGRRSFVERSCSEWWILSAKYELVHPDEEIEPYDVTLKRAGAPTRHAWSERLLGAIAERVRPVAGEVFEIHAGAEYRESGLVRGLQARGCAVEVPALGLALGEQLRFYRQAVRGAQ
jgi:hypothetical protein